MALGRFPGTSIARPIARDISMRKRDATGGDPPPVSVPVDVAVDSDDGFGNAQMNFISATGNVMIRFAGRSDSAGPLAFDVHWNNEPMTRAVGILDNTGGNAAFMEIYYIRGGHVGAGVLSIIATTASAGRGALRIEDLPPELAAVQSRVGSGSVTADQATSFPEIASATNLVYSMVVWLSANAAPITFTADNSNTSYQPVISGTPGAALIFSDQSGLPPGFATLQWDSNADTVANAAYGFFEAVLD